MVPGMSSIGDRRGGDVTPRATAARAAERAALACLDAPPPRRRDDRAEWAHRIRSSASLREIETQLVVAECYAPPAARRAIRRALGDVRWALCDRDRDDPPIEAIVR